MNFTKITFSLLMISFFSANTFAAGGEVIKGLSMTGKTAGKEFEGVGGQLGELTASRANKRSLVLFSGRAKNLETAGTIAAYDKNQAELVVQANLGDHKIVEYSKVKILGLNREDEITEFKAALSTTNDDRIEITVGGHQTENPTVEFRKRVQLEKFDGAPLARVQEAVIEDPSKRITAIIDREPGQTKEFVNVQMFNRTTLKYAEPIHITPDVDGRILAVNPHLNNTVEIDVIEKNGGVKRLTYNLQEKGYELTSRSILSKQVAHVEETVIKGPTVSNGGNVKNLNLNTHSGDK